MSRSRSSEYDEWFDWEPSHRTENPSRRTRRRSRPRRCSGALRWAAVLGVCALLLLGAGKLWDGAPPAAVSGGGGTQTPFQPGTELLEQLQSLAREEPAAEALLACPEDYPEELLELAVRNPEALDFVVRYPQEKDAQPAGSVGAVERGIFPLLMQWDPRWGCAPYGDGLMALNGCGPTALAMVVCGLTGDGSVTPWTVAQYADEAGYYVEGAGSKWELMSTGCQHFGLVARELPLDRSVMVRVLEDGQPIVCSVGPGDFTTSGHFILITGVEDGKFHVNDPNRRANSEKLWDYDTLAPQIRNLWAYTLAG
ncbi:MAG: C39 family peptidase [Lawsonibacter sp.]|nr:C39 family peptidase [Oscillospiraceae bacterium]